MTLIEAVEVSRWVVVLLVAGGCMAGLLVYALVGWDRAADAAERWRVSAEAYAKLARRGRAQAGPALTVVAPQFHAPSDEDRRRDPFGVHVRPTRVMKAPWSE
jgi:hypothetical protein